MDFLELKIHQRILTDIAAIDPKCDEDILHAQRLITSKVLTRDKSALEEQVEDVTEDEDETPAQPRVYMPVSRVHCNIAFGELVANFSNEYLKTNIVTLFPALIEILADIPFIDFDKCLSWDSWSLPDQLTCSTISALLKVSNVFPEYREDTTKAVSAFLTEVARRIESSDALDIIGQLTPALHGLYRAISSTSFPWSLSQWLNLAPYLNGIRSPTIVDKLNHLPTLIVQDRDTEPETLQYIQTFISRYLSNGRPLSGYFIVCCVIETQWTILAQVLAPPRDQCHTSEAAAANQAWSSLMHDAALEIDVTSDEADMNLRATITYALQCFADLLAQIEEMDADPSVDTYAWETMSESLKLATICSVVLREFDDVLLSHLFLLLSADSPISDNLVQEAALKATTVAVQNFPEIAPRMANQLRRFVTSPLAIFEFKFASETRAPPPLAAAAKCMALCIRIAPGDDLIMSNMYSLLNYIAATAKDLSGSVSSSMSSSLRSLQEHSAAYAEETGLSGLSEDEKRLVGISTISVVTRLALEFNVEEVTRLTISMLLQRIRSAEPTVEAAIAYNLVDLALSAPESAFVDIIRVFSSINRSANPDDPRFSNNMVLAAQTRLAHELHQRPEYYQIYLVELLSLFADKGVAIQNLAISNPQVKTEDMIEQLESLLLPIDALLRHEDFEPNADDSPSLVALFRNMWFLCVLFNFTSLDKDVTAMDWQKTTLAHIATKTPNIVLEESADTATSELEYNSVLRQEYMNTVIAKHRASLTNHLSLRSSDVRYLSSGHIIFLLAMHDIEHMRSTAGLTSSLGTYFVNDSLNKTPGLNSCMESIAEKVIRDSIAELSRLAAEQVLPACLSTELRTLLIYSTHRISKARDIASKYLNRLITTFPSLMCDPPLVFAILEVLTLLRRACENEYTDEYNPVFEYYSDRTDITLKLSDDYRVRNEILAYLHRNATTWFDLALAKAPIELQSTLQKYLAVGQTTGADSTELGATMAEKFGKAIGPIQRQLGSVDVLPLKTDRAKALASQLASKAYFAGEAAGIRLASREGADKLEKLPPQSAPTSEIQALKDKMAHSLDEIRNKNSTLTVQDLKRLLFRCAATLISMSESEHTLLHYLVALPFEVSTPSAISSGIEVWSWVIVEKPEMEVTVMTEILSAWTNSIHAEKGMFSRSINYDDPFFHPISYSPTDKDIIDRGMNQALRQLTPHHMVLKMLFSRLQAAKYRRPSVMFIFQTLVLRSARASHLLSSHPLARDLRFSFLLFGFETLRSSHLDLYCESLLRQSLYDSAFAWFAVRPQWTYGANRVQLDSDIKILNEVLSCLKSDAVRGTTSISSLSLSQSLPSSRNHVSRLREINLPLRALVENEIYRLAVWVNPTNDTQRPADPTASSERTLTEQWPNIIRTLWHLDPALVIYLQDRFKAPIIRQEVIKMVRSSPADVLDTPEALPYFLGDHPEVGFQRDFKHLLLWAPVPPVIANTLFEKRYNNDPCILQYAHRVLEQHPVELTFFFVPQVVQALRYDDYGYVARFIFETAKISQLFCHQIIWNMKANCYKDDAAEIEDSLKPALDEMTALVVDSLSGEARAFYDKEFGFFNEVTSISGKLKPFIKKTKPEKKAKIDEEMARITVEVGVYLPSNPDGKVVDIDKKSGRPLQSHAKAPFMATFKVRKERITINSDPDSVLDGDGPGVETRTEYDVWQQAIFKVGDDCRQDVLALQVIAMFKNIYTSLGLTLYLFPYRVTATAPGCGVIDVVPNATSRDEMGRAKVNDLLDFFVAKYGGQDTVSFQRARLNFIQSMAAYSVACYILQIKDRHNGNIMIDGDGHIVHIARPGGVKFEPGSFKLNHEMVVLMGGKYSQGYHLFQQLTVKAFLALRPHAEQIISTVQLMLDTGLPSFKGEGTIKRLRERFALGYNDRQAAEWMMSVIKNAHENVRSTAYDEFQRLQNGIPYK